MVAFAEGPCKLRAAPQSSKSALRQAWRAFYAERLLYGPAHYRIKMLVINENMQQDNSEVCSKLTFANPLARIVSRK